MKSLAWGVVLAVCAATAMGEQLKVTGKTREGTLQSYEDNKFHFVTSEGRFLKEHYGRVTQLTFDKPQKVSYQVAGAAKEETALLKIYDKRKFVLLKDGKEVIVPQAKMKVLTPMEEEVAAVPGAGGEFASGRYPIPKVNVDALVGGGKVTPAQQAVAEKFKAAKQSYDEFLAQSSAMVAQMDKMTGAKREDMLNQLRKRKGDEQPLKNALISAYKALSDAFAEPGA